MNRQRLYGLFYRDGKRWRREGEVAYPKSYAVIIWQNKLLEHFFGTGPERKLKPVQGSYWSLHRL